MRSAPLWMCFHWNLCELNAKIVSYFFPLSLPLSAVVACAPTLVHRHCTKRTIPARLKQKIKNARNSHCLLPAGVNESLSRSLLLHGKWASWRMQNSACPIATPVAWQKWPKINKRIYYTLWCIKIFPHGIWRTSAKFSRMTWWMLIHANGFHMGNKWLT